MSTGLTMGTISSVFGFQAGIIDRAQFSVLVSVVVASAILPTFFAQRYFHPKHAVSTLYTNDTDFRKFAFLEVRNPLEADA
jgi:hypothetical protein